jgi:N-acetylneuraminic acid mutarotase
MNQLPMQINILRKHKISYGKAGLSRLAALTVTIIALITVIGVVSIAINALSLVEPTTTFTVVSTSTEFGIAGFSSLTNSDYWTPAPPMNVNRSFSAVTTLTNGSVLVAGGYAGTVANSSLASAEMYNPVTNKWTMVANMLVGAAGARSVLLSNGNVLVAGGLGNSGILTTCQLYDPSTNTWSLTGNLTQATFDEQIITLNNGNVLVVGGDFSGGENNATQIYNPNGGTWSDAAPQPIARADMIVVKLTDGNVLVAGGHTAYAPTLLSEIYDPTTNTWNQTASLVVPGGDSGGVMLQNGDVLMVGGYTPYNDSENTFQYLYTAQIFNPTADNWTMTGDLNFPRGEIGLSTVVLNNGEVLVPGGNYQPETGQNTAELYNPSTGTWSMAGVMSVPHGSGTMAVLLDNGKVLVFGGLLPHICNYCGSGTPGNDLATNSADLFDINGSSSTTTSTTTT